MKDWQKQKWVDVSNVQFEIYCSINSWMENIAHQKQILQICV